MFHIAENTGEFVNINRRLLWESQETEKCNVWSECRGIGVKAGGWYVYHWALKQLSEQNSTTLTTCVGCVTICDGRDGWRNEWRAIVEWDWQGKLQCWEKHLSHTLHGLGQDMNPASAAGCRPISKCSQQAAGVGSHTKFANSWQGSNQHHSAGCCGTVFPFLVASAGFSLPHLLS